MFGRAREWAPQVLSNAVTWVDRLWLRKGIPRGAFLPRSLSFPIDRASITRRWSFLAVRQLFPRRQSQSLAFTLLFLHSFRLMAMLLLPAPLTSSTRLPAQTKKRSLKCKAIVSASPTKAEVSYRLSTYDSSSRSRKKCASRYVLLAIRRDHTARELTLPIEQRTHAQLSLHRRTRYLPGM
jgi:hypothetical protein